MVFSFKVHTLLKIQKKNRERLPCFGGFVVSTLIPYRGLTMGVGYNSLGYRLYILLKIKKKERQKDSGAATPIE